MHLITTKKEFIYVSSMYEGLAFNCEVTIDLLNALIQNRSYYITVLETHGHMIKINVMEAI